MERRKMLSEKINLLNGSLNLLNDYVYNQKSAKFSAKDIVGLAEDILNSPHGESFSEMWHKYLDLTRRSFFLKSLESREDRYRWADTTFRAIEASAYNFNDLFRQRVEAHPERILFKVAEGNKLTEYSYKWVNKRIRQIAAAIYNMPRNSTEVRPPRVAIYSENTLEGACTDLACLTYGIYDAPLNIHFGVDILGELFTKSGINIAVTDTEQRMQTLLKTRDKFSLDLKIIYSGYEKIDEKPGVYVMEKLLAALSSADTNLILADKKPAALHEPCTALFTSGSTGQAKGVVFTMYNLITKRFARAAALPDVTENEVLLCYLPLYHTFGRYLEMLGMLFWGGTYIFAGNPSVETLIALMQKVNPTGLISIPLRWVQIRDQFLEQSSKATDKKLFHKLVGERLRWGLSAAGYLEPKVFTFFHNHGVELCSGFGMTEATGGVCMTPPGEYYKNSVGIPLPGVQIRFGENGELEISGHYIARYLEPDPTMKDGWLSTGDLFKIDENGHLYIIDRVKDIYKNIKGQTIAPRLIESMFENVPGFRRTFLVGDGMSYNTLLIVPDMKDPGLKKAASKKKLTDYFRPIIASANKDLAPYERIVDFAILERDFEEQKGELTSKGTFRRKNIEAAFTQEISKMYRYPNLEFKIDDLKVLIPRWMIRDLAVTEYDIERVPHGILNKLNNCFLTIKRNYKTERIRIGDFEYIISSNNIDLGVFVRQPMLWSGNISLINFAMCKDGWDTSYESISSQVFLSESITSGSGKVPSIHPEKFSDSKLRGLNEIIIKALYSRGSESLESLQELESLLHRENHRIVNLIRLRIESLALHPDFEMRTRAYKILLFDEPRLDYSKYLPAFINSGLPFLNKESIEEISAMDFEKGRIEAFRQRLESYRATMHWPASQITIVQFKRILELLVNFTRHDRKAYSAVREELISWALHKKEPQLAAYAQDLFNHLSVWFESTFELTQFERVEDNWKERITFQEGFSGEETARIEKILCCNTFLKEALLLVFDEEEFLLKSVPKGGIWVSRILSPHNTYLYRVSINTVTEKHYDIMILVKDDISKSAVRETINWMIKISGYPNGPSVLPRFGNFRSSMGAASLAYINELSGWDKIREYSSIKTVTATYKNEYKWKVLFVRAIAAFFRAWKHSGKAIVPGSVAPSNVVVSEPDVRQSARILSLSGWQPCKNTSMLVCPIIKNFYLQTIGNYPWNKDFLKIEWIFDAAMEAFERDEAIEFLLNIKADIVINPVSYGGKDLAAYMDKYLRRLEQEPYIPLALLSATERYNEWLAANPNSTPEAREQFIKQLFSLYHLDRLIELYRYIFYRDTYFASASELVKYRLEKLIKAMFTQPDEHATRLIELSELQDAITDPADRQVFSKLVFPDVPKPMHIELVRVGDEEHKNIIVKTVFKDIKNVPHIVRSAISPYEVGSLYRLFILNDYPVNITAEDQFLILTDDEEQDNVNGGVCFKMLEPELAHLEGIVVAAPYRGRGIGARLLDDFCSRMMAEGIKVVTTHFYLTNFFQKHQFKVDARWGGLVRFLSR